MEYIHDYLCVWLYLSVCLFKGVLYSYVSAAAFYTIFGIAKLILDGLFCQNSNIFLESLV